MTRTVAIVGLGQIGMQADLDLDAGAHVYSHARAFSGHTGFSLVAGFDAVKESRALFEAHYRAPAFAAVGAELAMLAPDVVVIAVPTASHAQVLDEVLAHCRPAAILCEKPLSYDIAEARRMVAACDKAGSGLFVNYMRRADPAVQEVRTRLLDQRIRTPLKGVVWYSKGVFNNGSHFLDLLQYWLGPASDHAILKPGRRLGPDFEPDFLLRFKAGEVVFLAAREEDYSHYTVELVTPNGRLRYEQGGEQVLWQGTVSAAAAPGYVVLDAEPEAVKGDLAHIQWHVADQLAAALQGKPSSLCRGSDALNVLETLQTICATL